jgi:hypothetical protein
MNEAPQKPRPDATLKTLPDERQAQIWEMLRKKSYEQVAKELRADGIQTSRNAVFEFYSWYWSRQRFAEDNAMINHALEELKKEVPSISEDQLFARGQEMFSLLAYMQKDSKGWKRAQDVRSKRLLTDLELQKFQRETCELFLKWAADQRAQEIAASGGLAQSEKIERLGQLMFGEDWSDAPKQ